MHGQDREQVLDERSLCTGTDAASAMIGQQADANLGGARPSHGTPVDLPCVLAANLDHEPSSAVIDQPILLPLPFNVACRHRSVSEPLKDTGGIGVGIEPHQHPSIGLLDRSKANSRLSVHG